MTEQESLTWVIVAASHTRLTHEQATEIAQAVIAAGWRFRPDLADR